MRQFARNITFFFLTILLSAVLLQLLISWRIEGKTIRGHDNLEQTSNINADMVFLGSSRCWAHFNPAFFDSAFKLKTVNIGVDGHTELSMVILRLRDYLSRNRPPKYALLNLDPMVNEGSLSVNKNFIHKNDYARYAFFPSQKEKVIADYFKFNWQERYIPLYAVFKYDILKDCFILNDNIGWIKDGYEAHTESWDTTGNPVTDEMKKNYISDQEFIKVKPGLELLLNLCHQNGIKLIAVQTPVYKVIYDEKLFKRTAVLAGDLQIPFIDLNKPSIINNIGFFYNSNHLNSRGVYEMNRELIKDSIFFRSIYN